MARTGPFAGPTEGDHSRTRVISERAFSRFQANRSYAELTNLAIEQKQWKDVVETTDRVLQVSDANSPKLWFYNAAGNFNLGRIDQAEKSLMRGMRLDREHRVPQMEYLLGLVFARKQDYPSAVTHVSEYLRLSPNAPDSAVARQQLDEFQKLAESAAGQASR